jgi:hypothetical protein
VSEDARHGLMPVRRMVSEEFDRDLLAGIDPNWEAPHTGPAAAAVLAAGIGLLTLGGANLLATLFQPFEETLSIAASLFFPGGNQLASYGGKELVALIAWLIGWLILHRLLRRRHVGLTGTAAIFVCCLVASTLFFWPPFIRLLAPLARSL